MGPQSGPPESRNRVALIRNNGDLLYQRHLTHGKHRSGAQVHGDIGIPAESEHVGDDLALDLRGSARPPWNEQA